MKLILVGLSPVMASENPVRVTRTFPHVSVAGVYVTVEAVGAVVSTTVIVLVADQVCIPSE